MYQMNADGKILIRLDVPVLVIPNFFKISLSEIIADIFTAIIETLISTLDYGNGVSDVDWFFDIFLEIMSERLINVSSWDYESGNYEQAENENILIVVNFIEMNRLSLYVFVQRVFAICQIVNTGLMETGRTISRIEEHMLTQNEIILEVFYERRF